MRRAEAADETASAPTVAFVADTAHVNVKRCADPDTRSPRLPSSTIQRRVPLAHCTGAHIDSEGDGVARKFDPLAGFVVTLVTEGAADK